MRGCRFLLIAVVVAGTAVPAPAGIIFNRKPKADPGQRIPSLIAALREPEEKKRAAAADELRNFDPNAYPEIVPALVESALHDNATSVRLNAIQSLGKMRPISQRAGWALEQAAARDQNLRVQLQARSLLIQYRLSGYHSKGGEDPHMIRTEEPPLAPPLETTPIPPARPMTQITPRAAPKLAPPVAIPVARPTPAPQPQAPAAKPDPASQAPVAKPDSAGQPQGPVVPVEPPTLEKPPPVDDGPDLGPE